jgi:hypothetical protein
MSASCAPEYSIRPVTFDGVRRHLSPPKHRVLLVIYWLEYSVRYWCGENETTPLQRQPRANNAATWALVVENREISADAGMRVVSRGPQQFSTFNHLPRPTFANRSIEFQRRSSAAPTFMALACRVEEPSTASEADVQALTDKRRLCPRSGSVVVHDLGGKIELYYDVSGVRCQITAINTPAEGGRRTCRLLSNCSANCDAIEILPRPLSPRAKFPEPAGDRAWTAGTALAGAMRLMARLPSEFSMRLGLRLSSLQNP